MDTNNPDRCTDSLGCENTDTWRICHACHRRREEQSWRRADRSLYAGLAAGFALGLLACLILSAFGSAFRP